MTTIPVSTFPLRTAVPASGARRSEVRPRLRITRRGRAVVAVLIAVPLALGAVALGLGQGAAASTETASHATAGSASTSFRWITVGHGDTLWSIARRIAPSADPRDVIADIVTLNQLPSASVDAGQRIAIPAQYR